MSAFALCKCCASKPHQPIKSSGNLRSPPTKRNTSYASHPYQELMLLCLALLYSVVLTASSHTIPSVIPRAVNDGKIITPEFSDFVQNVMQRLDVPGLSLAISRHGGTPEVGAWGHKTEDGDPVTPDVSPPHLFLHCVADFCTADALPPCILLQSVPLQRTWCIDR
jgi:hypothetical protein